MKGKFFIDTNIIIYSFNNNEKDKQKTSINIIKQALSDNNGIISYQVIQEFLNVSLQKFNKPLSVKDCKEYLDKVLLPLCEIFPDEQLYKEAIDIKNDFKFSFYDSLIISASVRANCKFLYTEDLSNKQKVNGLELINPFL